MSWPEDALRFILLAGDAGLGVASVVFVHWTLHVLVLDETLPVCGLLALLSG